MSTIHKNNVNTAGAWPPLEKQDKGSISYFSIKHLLYILFSSPACLSLIEYNQEVKKITG